MITLYQFEISPFCDKIRRILDFKKIPYRVEEVSMLRAAFGIRRINPIGKLPCIEDEGEWLADSTDIALHLEKKYPDASLFPAGLEQQGLCRVLEDWADESLYFYEVRLRFGMASNSRIWMARLLQNDPWWFRLIAGFAIRSQMRKTLKLQGLGRKPDAMVLSEIDVIVRSISEMLGQGTWLVGNEISVADISVFVQLHCIRVTPEGAEVLERYPSVLAWMDRVDEATRVESRSDL
jgi:glutathione S-transferase